MSALPYPLSLIMLGMALVVSVFSAYATISGSHRRFRADVLSANRQRWIETFRDRLAELLSVMNAAQVVKRNSSELWRGGTGPASANPGLADKLEKTFQAIAQIQLMTTDAAANHRALNAAIAVAVGYIQEDELHEAELTACWEEIIQLGRTLIREEWSRVKRGV